MAWLHATPKPAPPPPGGKLPDPLPEVYRLSRIEYQNKKGITPHMPPNPVPHIIARWIEIGMTEETGMGAARLSWREISEWQRNTNVELAPWEARLIRSLSAAYLSESRRAEDENRPPPWRAEVTQGEISAERALLENILG